MVACIRVFMKSAVEQNAMLVEPVNRLAEKIARLNKLLIVRPGFTDTSTL